MISMSPMAESNAGDFPSVVSAIAPTAPMIMPEILYFVMFSFRKKKERITVNIGIDVINTPVLIAEAASQYTGDKKSKKIFSFDFFT